MKVDISDQLGCSYKVLHTFGGILPKAYTFETKMELSSKTLTLRNFEYILPLTLIEDKEATMWATVSHRRVPMPSSIAVRIIS